VRLDGCVYEGWTVPIDYDPLLAKLAVWNATRETAIARMLRALREYEVAGIHTNIAFFRQILEDEEFRAGRLHTQFVDEFPERRKPFDPPPELESIAALVAAFHAKRSAPRAETAQPQRSRWLDIGRDEALR
jgi:acetyl-CoA carboxylase biotin carboxylase subunit